MLPLKASGGEFAESIDLTINKLILDYDLILVLGGTVPHEVAGFSGGAKYFFPGIRAPNLRMQRIGSASRRH